MYVYVQPLLIYLSLCSSPCPSAHLPVPLRPQTQQRATALLEAAKASASDVLEAADTRQ